MNYLLGSLSVLWTGILGVVAKEVVRFIRSHQKEKLALAAVKFVEETFKDLDGKDKFQKAVDYLVNRLKRIGIKNVSNEELQGLIQSSVTDIRSSLKKAEADPSNDVSPEPVKEAVQEVVQEVEKPVEQSPVTEAQPVASA